jgi:hypothetical protein
VIGGIMQGTNSARQSDQPNLVKSAVDSSFSSDAQLAKAVASNLATHTLQTGLQLATQRIDKINGRDFLAQVAADSFASYAQSEAQSGLDKGQTLDPVDRMAHALGEFAVQAAIRYTVGEDHKILDQLITSLIQNYNALGMQGEKQTDFEQPHEASHDAVHSEQSGHIEGSQLHRMREQVEAENTSMGGGAHPAYDADIVKGEMTPIDWGADSYGVHDGEMTPFAFRERSLSERAANNLSKYPWVANLVSSRAWQGVSHSLNQVSQVLAPVNRSYEQHVAPKISGPAEFMVGAGEMVLGALATDTGIGAVPGVPLFVHGGDMAFAGVRNTWSQWAGSGEYHETYFQQGLQHYMSPGKAMAAEFLFALAAGGGSIAARGPQIAARAGRVSGNMSSFFGRRGGVTKGVYLVDPAEIGFSQSSVSRVKTRFDTATGKSTRYSFDDIAESMKVNGWQGRPLNVVRMSDGTLTSLDNTRLLAARQAGIKVEINIHNFDAPISKDFSRAYTAEGRLEPKTWGEAIKARISIQKHTYYQNRNFAERFNNGSVYDPYLIGGTP